MRSMSARLRRRPDALAVALVAAFLAAGCAVETGGGLDEAQAREIAVGVGVQEGRRPDSDLFRVRLEVGNVEERTAPSGSRYWEVTLVDATGTPRLCVRIRSAGQSVGSRRCDPEGAPPPAAPAIPGDDGGEVRS